MFKDPMIHKKKYPPKLCHEQNRPTNIQKNTNIYYASMRNESSLNRKNRNYYSRGKENNIDQNNVYFKHEHKNCDSEDKNKNRQSKNEIREKQKLKEMQSKQNTKKTHLFSLNSNKVQNNLDKMKLVFRKVPSASKLINSPNKILADSITKDGQFRLVSKILIGQQLAKAVEYENKMFLKNRKLIFEEDLEKFKIPNFQTSKISSRENGAIMAYAVNTNRGCTRNYNEDRVSIILNINKKGIKSSFFAVYDGHGGSTCCDYLRDILHENIINHKLFPFEPKKALMEGISKCQQEFLMLVKEKYEKTGEIDRSGSCVIIVMVIGDECYVANIGDSRALISAEKGKNAYSLSRDHRPTDRQQQDRIQKNGGNIYRTEVKKRHNNQILQQEQKCILKFSNSQSKLNCNSNQILNVGPLRVFPGKLSVTRTIGDIEAKHPNFGGKQNCIISTPQIKKFRFQYNEDFIIIGCDGIFQKLDSAEIISIIWNTIDKKLSENNETKRSIHQICGACVEQIIKVSLAMKSSDNLTVMMIGLVGLKQYIEQKSKLNQKLINYRSI